MTEHIRDVRTCSVTSLVSKGFDCSHMIGDGVDTLSFKETIDFLSPHPARRCVPSPLLPGVCAEDQSQGTPVDLPARAGAIAVSADDYRIVLTEIATMCRLMGKHCTYEMRATIRRLAERTR